MKTQQMKAGRREMLKKTLYTALAASTLGLPGGAQAAKFAGTVHGVCFLGGKNCKVTYVDLGLLPKTNGTPIYVFPADRPNPLDRGGNYRPERLQNNVFAGSGKNWLAFNITSGSVRLFASTDGTTTIESTQPTPPGSPARDLTTNPFKSEEEIFAARDRGEVIVTPLNEVIDCPITDATPGDVVVDLNPTVGPFCKRSA